MSIVSNGSKITPAWFERYGKYIDILAVSCDSFCKDTNRLIGRHARGATLDHLDQLQRIKQWCYENGVAFKVNTVVNTYNKDENMTAALQQLAPMRWKVFQCLDVAGENTGTGSLRDVKQFLVSDSEFASFCDRHSSISVLVPENNRLMRDSYLLLDEYMRFLDCSGGAKEPTASILDIGVEAALRDAGFSQQRFHERGGR